MTEAGGCLYSHKTVRRSACVRPVACCNMITPSPGRRRSRSSLILSRPKSGSSYKQQRFDTLQIRFLEAGRVIGMWSGSSLHASEMRWSGPAKTPKVVAMRGDGEACSWNVEGNLFERRRCSKPNATAKQVSTLGHSADLSVGSGKQS